MGCDLCGASVGRVGRGGCLNCDLGDFGRWGVICVVRALGAWGWGGCLNWTVILGFWESGQSDLCRQRANYGVGGGGGLI